MEMSNEPHTLQFAVWPINGECLSSALADNSSQLLPIVNLSVISNPVLLINKIIAYDRGYGEKGGEDGQQKRINSNCPCPFFHITIAVVLFCSGVWISWRTIFHFIYREGALLRCILFVYVGVTIMVVGLLFVSYLYVF